MKAFVAIWEDRHTDTDAKVFSTADLAIAWAKKTAREYDMHGDLDESLSSSMKRGGWIYHANYTCEGDCIYVFPVTVDEP